MTLCRYATRPVKSFVCKTPLLKAGFFCSSQKTIDSDGRPPYVDVVTPLKNSKKYPDPSRFWVVDISNSFTKFSIATPHKIQKVHRHPTPKITLPWIQKTFNKSKLPVVLSSVVPVKTALFQKKLKSTLHLLHGKNARGIGIRYPQPQQIGADRLANAIAARHRYGAPCIVIDFGTAVTFDVINHRGEYVGGVIAPGLNLMTEYLHEKTALLPSIEIQKPQSPIGKSTREAMLSGAVYGYQGLVKEILLQLKKELRGKTYVVATGGQAQIVTQKIPEIQKIDPLLTLEGLRLWFLHPKAFPSTST